MRKVTFGFFLFALLAVFAVPTFAQDDMALPDFIQHTACDHDLTGSTVPIYHFGDLSGSYAFITQPLLAGLSDAIAYFNAHGGVCGAMLKSDVGTEYRDTAGDPNNVQPAYDYFSTLADKPDALILYASGDSERLRSQVAEDEIPVLISAGSVEGLYGEDGMTPGWIYATNPLYVDQFGAFCKYIADNPDTYPDPTIGYISWGGPVAAFGEAAYTPESISYCTSVGVTVLDTPEYFLPLPTADLTNNVQNLVDAGANILYTNSLATGPFLVAKTVHDLGLEDTVTVSGVNWALDTSVGLLSRTALGTDGLPVANGLVGSLPFHWWNERQIPGIAFINEQADANSRTLPTKNIAYLLGWATVDTYIELYTRGANELGSIEAITGKDMKGLIENLVYSPMGLYNFDFKGGSIRALPDDRMAMMGFLNATGDGMATSGDDAMKIPQDDGTNIFVPILIPLTDFSPAPDLHPGGADVPG